MLRFKKEDGSSYPETQEHSLGEYLSFKNGLNVPKEKFGTGIKYISVLDILNNPVITYDVIEGLVDIDEDMLQKFSVEYGDILFQRSSETKIDAGKSNVYVDKEKIATFGGFVIRGKKIGDYNPEYMNYLLRSSKVRKQIMQKAQGEQHVNVGQEILSEIRVDMHCKEEQERIANILSSIDRKISAQENIIGDLENTKKGTLQKIFKQEIRFKDDCGNKFPEWENKKIKEICMVSNGKGNTQDKVDNGKYPFYVRSNNIEKSEKYIFDCEAVLTVGDGVGVGKVYHYVNEKFNLHQRCYACYDFKGILGKYFYYYFSSFFYQRVKKLSAKGSVDSVRLNFITDMLIKIPCLEEQKKIADCLSALDRKIEAEKKILEDWKQIKKALLQQMFV